MICPKGCNTNLRISDREGVEIDYCPICRGVWLDRGELDKIIDRSTEEREYRPPAVAAQPSNDYRAERDWDDDYGPRGRKKRKNFLKDIFDFD